MPAILVQIDLPGAKRSDYSKLSALMNNAGWKSQLSGDDGKLHSLVAGMFVGSHDNIGKLASGLRMKIHDSGLHSKPVVLAAVIQDWTIVSA